MKEIDFQTLCMRQGFCLSQFHKYLLYICELMSDSPEQDVIIGLIDAYEKDILEVFGVNCYVKEDK